MMHTSIASGAGSLRSAGNPGMLKTAFFYCLPIVGVGHMFSLVNMYLLKFSTDVLLIAPAHMGVIFLMTRIWDACSDPVVGYFTDKTNTKLGRRRPWFFASLIPIGAFFSLVWNPPRFLDGSALTIWVGVAILLFYTAEKIFLVPHTALGAELSSDTHMRTSIFSVRFVCWHIGTILALGGMHWLIQAENERLAASQLAMIGSTVTVLLILTCACGIKERPEYRDRGAGSVSSAFGDVWRNPHARLLSCMIFVQSLGGSCIIILTPYTSQYVVGRLDLLPVFILSYMIPTTLCAPLWPPLAKRMGKKTLWLCAMAVSIVVFGNMFFIGEGDVAKVIVLSMLAGTAGGCGAVLAPSVQADVIDYDARLSGERKEGAYYTSWSFVFKAGFGVGYLATLNILDLAGYTPNTVQTQIAKQTMMSLYAIVPSVCFLAALLIFRRYSLQEHTP